MPVVFSSFDDMRRNPKPIHIRLFGTDGTPVRYITEQDVESMGSEIEPVWWNRSDARILQGYRLREKVKAGERSSNRQSCSGISPTEAHIHAHALFVSRETQEEVDLKVFLFGKFPSWCQGITA